MRDSLNSNARWYQMVPRSWAIWSVCAVSWRVAGCYTVVFFFSSRRRHTRLQGDWSSDVCSSDLPTSAPAQGGTAQDLRGTEVILIAEDHESIREMARQSLLHLGYKVLSAGDGEEADRKSVV